MKRIYNYLYVMVAAALVAGCSTDNLSDATNTIAQNGELTVNIEEPESRAEFGNKSDNGYKVSYSASDEMLLWEVGEVSSKGYRYVRIVEPKSTTIAENGLTASFSYDLGKNYVAGDLYPGTTYPFESVFYTGILPRGAFAGFWENYPTNDVNPSITEASDGFIRLNVPREQTPTATSPDPNAIILKAYAQPLPENGVITTRFEHLLAYMKITIKGLPAGYKMTKLQIGGDSRISFANDTDRYCKWSFTDASLNNGNGFESTTRGGMLIINTSELEPQADGSYVVWAACKPHTSSMEATPSFTPYSSVNDHIESKLIPVTRDGSAGSIALKRGEVASFTINYGYGNDLLSPKLSASTRSVDASTSQVSFSWDAVGGADHYIYKINSGEEQITTENSVSINVTPGAEVNFSVRAVPAENSGYTASDWSSTTIIAEYYKVALEMSEVDEGDILSYKATLIWSEVEGAVGYSYKIGANGSEVKIGNVTEYTFTNLEQNTYYSIYLRALADENSTTLTHSDWVEKLILTSTKEPLVMGSITIDDVSERTVTASWADVEGAVSYRYRLGDGSEGVAVSGTPITGLTASTTYTLQIMACAAVESDFSDSAWSQAVEFTTSEATGPLYSWSSDEFAAWALEIGTTELRADSSYAGLGFFMGNSSGFDIVNDGEKSYLKSMGSSDKGKNYFYFTSPGSGRVVVKGFNNKTSDKTLRIIVDGKETNYSIAKQQEYTVEHEVSAEGSLIKICTRDSNIFIYSISFVE